MEKEQLVELVTTEVMRRISGTNSCPQALAIITGGTIGLETGLGELRSLQATGLNLAIVLSEAAEKIVGIARIKKELGKHTEIVTAHSPYPKELLQQADLVLVPVLTQNTAAKLAATITDTMASYLLLSALLQNKPVLAAIDAADPGNRSNVQMSKLAPALREALETNLVKIGTYGVQLTNVAKLASEAKKLLIKPCEGDLPTNPGKKKVLDAEAIRNAVLNGEKIITVPADTIVTPLALDLARDYKIEIAQYTVI